MGHKLLVLGAVVGLGVVAYLRFPQLQTIKFNFAENWYQERVVRAKESHGQTEEELMVDMEAVFSGEEREIPTEIEESLASEGKILETAQRVTAWQQNLGLPSAYLRFLDLKQEVDDTRMRTYQTWQKAVLTWVRVRQVVAQFETTRRKVAQTTTSWKEGGMTTENVEELKQSLDEIDNLRNQVDKLAEEGTLTAQLVAFFEQAFSDFSKMRQAVEAIERGDRGEGEELVGNLATSVKGDAVTNKERLLSDWAREKLAPRLAQSRGGYGEQEKMEFRLEVMREALKETGTGEAGASPLDSKAGAI